MQKFLHNNKESKPNACSLFFAKTYTRGRELRGYGLVWLLSTTMQKLLSKITGHNTHFRLQTTQKTIHGVGKTLVADMESCHLQKHACNSHKTPILLNKTPIFATKTTPPLQECCKNPTTPQQNAQRQKVIKKATTHCTQQPFLIRECLQFCKAQGRLLPQPSSQDQSKTST